MSATNEKAPRSSSKSSGSHDTGDASISNEIAFEAGLKALEKISSDRSNLNVPVVGRRGRSQSEDTLSLISADDLFELRRVHSTSFERGDDPEESEPQRGWKGKIQRFWIRNKGLVWVICAQAFGALMNVSTRLLESEENGGMHPLQILFARMSITGVLAMLYMYYTKTPDFPFGAKEVRWILVARGVGGFWGVFGTYWSLQYLPLSDATVLTFLAPIIACWVCSKLLHEPFTRIEQIGGFVSLAGVVLIAQPTTIFSQKSSSSSSTTPSGTQPDSSQNETISTIVIRALSADEKPTSAQRLAAVGVSMIGVLGASVAYITIRWIGKRAHPLISVNYFAVWSTIVSGFCLAFIPSIPFILPSTLKQWTLLLILGTGGFLLQFLLTAGLRYEKSSRATNMVYSQMLFALAADKIIWNDTPGLWSLGGSALILGSAVVIAVQKASAEKTKEEGTGLRDEEAAIMEGIEGAVSDGETSEDDRYSTDRVRHHSLGTGQRTKESTESRRESSAEVEEDRKDVA